MTRGCYLLDMNGTIRDDFLPVLNSVNDVLREFGLKPLSLQKYREKASPNYWKLYQELGFGESDKHRVGELFESFFESKYASQARAFPDARSTIEELKGRGRIVGIVSNLTRRRLDEHIEEYGLRKFLDVSISREDTGQSKPSPEPLLAAFRYLGVAPDQGSYTGDQDWDMKAAHAAGTSSFAISRAGSYHSRTRLQTAMPDIIIPCLSRLLYLDRL